MAAAVIASGCLGVDDSVEQTEPTDSMDNEDPFDEPGDQEYTLPEDDSLDDEEGFENPPE